MSRISAISIAVAATAAVAAPVAAAGTIVPLSLPQALKVANHVRHREARNAFHLRQRIGGPFHLSHAYCDQGVTLRRALCRYDAVELAADANGLRTSCTIDVRVRLRGSSRVTWRRSIEACADSARPAPPSA